MHPARPRFARPQRSDGCRTDNPVRRLLGGIVARKGPRCQGFGCIPVSAYYAKRRPWYCVPTHSGDAKVSGVGRSRIEKRHPIGCAPPGIAASSNASVTAQSSAWWPYRASRMPLPCSCRKWAGDTAGPCEGNDAPRRQAHPPVQLWECTRGLFPFLRRPERGRYPTV